MFFFNIKVPKIFSRNKKRIQKGRQKTENDNKILVLSRVQKCKNIQSIVESVSYIIR